MYLLGPSQKWSKQQVGQEKAQLEFYAAERKKELITFATAWMELESIMLSEISQTVRDKYHICSFSEHVHGTKDVSSTLSGH